MKQRVHRLCFLEMLTDGLYFTCFLDSCFDSHSDGIHSLQSIHCWDTFLQIWWRNNLMTSWWVQFSRIQNELIQFFQNQIILCIKYLTCFYFIYIRRNSYFTEGSSYDYLSWKHHNAKQTRHRNRYIFFIQNTISFLFHTILGWNVTRICFTHMHSVYID